MTSRATQRLLCVSAATLLYFGAASTWAQAATFSIADGDVVGLITAIQAANAGGGSNIINLATNGTYVLTAVAENAPDYGGPGPAGLPYVRSQITINGNGATIQRSNAPGTPSFVILAVSGWSPSGDFSVNANLTLNRVTLTGGYGSVGGLALTESTALIQNSTITQNTGTNPYANAGGIFNFSGYLTIVNSTISYNTNDSGYGGAGILQFGCCGTSISFSTIFENQNVFGRGDSISNAFGAPESFVAKNSILANPTTQGPGRVACYGTAPVSEGHNIAGDASCAFVGIGDMNSTDPLLGPTVNNGGPTPTDLPAVNSPAIDAVPLAYCTDVFGVPVTTDQRGVSRARGPACDVGSVEVGPLYHVCLLYDPIRAVQSGATYPVKLQLCDGVGNDLSSSTITAHATSITQVSTSISGLAQDSGNANPDNDFRFSSTLGSTGGYIFNLSSKGLSTGAYRLNFTVTGDLFVYAAPFQVK